MSEQQRDRGAGGRLSRRSILSALVGLPLVGGLAYWWVQRGDRDEVQSASPGDDARTANDDDPQALGTAASSPPWLRDLALILAAIGPWRPGDRERAGALIGSFLRALTPEQSSRYSAADATLSALVKRFGDDAFAVDEVDLATLAPAERETLIALVVELHAALPVRFYAAREPPPGVCIANPAWHTEPPES
ncbi:hypothetical protein [Haliangium ochraceum]|uniref:Gluconate 2-dehydrogenase subunit 3 family protein n=1 Tax=Haliangium ochraceum (strain DSM 14365 / JCM 11303 / SMP-2) TaxID=502025 RepID=D0LXW4_HALO1|nr:hypothetical protein [Haliangium ochraceum]ACY14319.1 hypothetical protein Hoch_1770 [Haliangium ochraceum DSM 14365]